MGLVLGLEKKVLGVKELYNNFMWKDAEERNTEIVSKRENINKAMEEEKLEKAKNKLLKSQKEERNNNVVEQLVREKNLDVPSYEECVDEKSSVLGKIANKFKEKFVEEEEDFDEPANGYSRFWSADFREYDARVIDVKLLFDNKYTSFANTPSGMSLLSRNLDSDKLFILDDEDMFRVKKVVEVKPELPSDNKAYLLFETNKDNFVIEFVCTRSF